MRYNLTPDQPRPLAAVHAGTAPGQDARWRGCGAGPAVTRQRVDSTRFHDYALQVRNDRIREAGKAI